MRRLIQPTLLIVALGALALGGLALAQDRSPVRRGTDDGAATRGRGGIDGDRVGRRGPEGSAQLSAEELRAKQQPRVINLISPPRCGLQTGGTFRRALEGLQSSNDRFNVEIWGNKSTFFVLDSIFYFLRSNRAAYVTMFWIGPRGSVFIPFSNLKIEADRDHKIDPRNIIVEPVGLERWRVVATLEPHAFPCRGSASDFVAALDRVRGGLWAAGRWDVWSKVPRRRNRLRSRF